MYYCIIAVLLLVANPFKVRFFLSCYELGQGVKRFLLWIYWFISVGKINSQGQSRLGLYMCDVMVTRVCIVSVLVASCECVMEGALVQAVAQPGPQMCCQLEVM